MAKEYVLNITVNCWSLNKKNSVGPVSKWIRECSPKTIDDWRIFYFQKLHEMLQNKEIPLSPEDEKLRKFPIKQISAHGKNTGFTP